MGHGLMQTFTFEQAKAAYFNEDAAELSLASEQMIDDLAVWLEDNGYDSGYVYRLHDYGLEEMRCLMAEAAIEFAEHLK
jgi:hypothetical protein